MRTWHSAAFALLVLAPGAAAEVQKIPVRANQPARLTLAWPLDEEDLREPRGYNHHGEQPHRLARNLVIENTGRQPLRGLELVVNNRHWRDAAGILANAGATREDAAKRLFTFWTQARSHAASGVKAAEDPLSLLRFWDYSLCGEDTKALSRLFQTQGIAGASVPLNGHVAGQYEVNGRWSVVDGDQNVVYLALDNRTLASYEEIRKDPFLALRTKPFGRFAAPSLPASQFNAGLFEYIDPVHSKPMKTKKRDELPAPSVLVLYPGERLIFHYDRSPALHVGQPGAPEWRRAAPAALRLIEWQALPKARGWRNGPLTLATAWPILSAHNLATGAAQSIVSETPSFSATVPVERESDAVSIFMQATQLTFPAFANGENTVLLQSEGEGEVSLRLEYDTAGIPAQPKPPQVSANNLFRDEAPRFAIQVDAGCDRIWWQFADDPRFRFVAPNLEQVQAAATAVELDPLACSFLNDRSDYYFRAKAVRAGVWSHWSEPVHVRVEKARAPVQLAATPAADGKVRFTWNGAAEEFVLFGSNRLDFLPEIYTGQQIVSMRGLDSFQHRPNRNRVAATPEHFAEVKAEFRFYRLLARRGAMWSVPSEMITLPPSLATGVPPPTVFQIRWSRTEGSEPADVYLGEERPLAP